MHAQPMALHLHHYAVYSKERYWTYPEFDARAAFHPSLACYMTHAEFERSFAHINAAARVHPVWVVLLWAMFVLGNAGWIVDLFIDNDLVARIGLIVFVVCLLPYFPIRFCIRSRCRAAMARAVAAETQRHRTLFPQTACTWQLETISRCGLLSVSYAIVLDGPILQGVPAQMQQPVHMHHPPHGQTGHGYAVSSGTDAVVHSTSFPPPAHHFHPRAHEQVPHVVVQVSHQNHSHQPYSREEGSPQPPNPTLPRDPEVAHSPEGMPSPPSAAGPRDLERAQAGAPQEVELEQVQLHHPR